MVELADTRDLKSLGSDTIPVQVRSAAPALFFCSINTSIFLASFSVPRDSREPRHAIRVRGSLFFEKSARVYVSIVFIPRKHL